MKKTPNNNLYEGQVLINGADTITGYNAARALYNTGLTVFGHSNSNNSAYSNSRIWKKVYNGEFNVKTLRDIASEIQKEENSKDVKPVLLLSQDMAVEYVASHRDELGMHFAFSLPENNIISRLLDKTIFHSWCINNNIPVPQSYIVDNSTSLSNALKNLNYPLIIKPLVRNYKWDTNYPNSKLICIDNDKDIDNIPSNIFDLSKRFLVQEWIPGKDEDIYFVLVHINEKNNCVSLTAKKLLQWPVLSGSTAICISIENKYLTNLGEEILKKAGLIGLGSIEFKKHSNTNRYYVIEPTVGRNDYQSYIAPASGINLSLCYALDCLGYSYRTDSSQTQAIWIDEISSFRALFSSYRKHILTFNILSLFKSKIKFATWVQYDPVTFFRIINKLFINKIKRFINNIFRKLRE